ncbi:MAG: hypothetical protein U9N50_03220 [Pseudomonadota bacterium]|nr:hypothetical protein [Pseudomonadota bacterium]
MGRREKVMAGILACYSWLYPYCVLRLDVETIYKSSEKGFFHHRGHRARRENIFKVFITLRTTVLLISHYQKNLIDITNTGSTASLEGIQGNNIFSIFLRDL